MIPLNEGEALPGCPSRCTDGIWTFYDERLGPPATETRETLETFSALDLAGERTAIPAGARLSDVHLGPGPQDAAHPNPSLAAFHFKGQVYFVSAQELLEKTKVSEG